MTTKIDRRNFLTIAGAAIAAPSIARRAFAAEPLKVGFVTPLTGPLSFFSEHHDFVMNYFRNFTRSGLKMNGSDVPVEIIVKDSQSNPNRASEVAQQLIANDEVVLMIANATPETCNPVSDQCELNGVPCLTNDCPIEPWFEGRGGDPKTGFEYTYHFSFDTLSQAKTFSASWDSLQTNKVVGGLWPNDGDGKTYARIYKELLGPRGYKVVDPGRFDLPTGTYNSQIATFIAQQVEIVVGVLPPPEFTSFWNSAIQQNFRPKIVMLGKALELPPAVAPLGDRALGLSTDATWSQHFPFVSELTGMMPKQLTDAYETATGRQASFPIGGRFALLETMLDVLRRSKVGTDRDSVRDALRTTNYNSITGNIRFDKGIFPNVCSTPIVTTQWKRGAKWPMELAIVGNEGFREVPVTDRLTEIRYS
jgi:branched-chain amino acid transport system substrate-binding protein